MSLAWNHGPSRSMVSSLRAAHLSSRPLQKGCSYSTTFRPIYPKLVESSSNAFLRPVKATEVSSLTHRPSKGGGLQGLAQNDDIVSCEFWCTSRLPTRLNQSFSPWAHFSGRNANLKEDENTTEGAPSDSSQIPYSDLGKSQGFHPNLTSSNRTLYFEPSPSEFLIDTLQNIVLGCDDRRETQNWTVSGRGSHGLLMTPLSLKQRFKFKRSHRVSLQVIVADYIQFVDPVLQKWGHEAIFENNRAASEFEYALRSMLREDYAQYLNARKCDITDVMAWAWVLKGNTPHETALRMILLEADQAAQNKGTSSRVPSFIPLMLLRQRLDTKTFHLLLVYSLHLISGRPIPPLNSSPYALLNNTELSNQTFDSTTKKPLIDPNMCATYVVRLLHHARELWPESQLTVARAFAFYLNTLKYDSRDETNSSHKIVQLMVKKFNTCLRLLSLPCKTNPFASVSIQQQAQFELLKAMANYKPVLPVTRRGYQGLIAVQLAHKKTFAERQSADLKAASWPPWKEDKLGIDSQRGVEGMKSRAIRVMSQMKEAGYAHSRWEEVSRILAGWDTDNSPTIQTRALVRRPENLRGPSGRANHHAIWEARIRATRTVREAWACFLAYEAQGLSPHGAIYAAMAEKIIFRRKAMKSQFDQHSLALPGDSLEVFPEPSSVRDWIYTSTDPPTLHELVERMLSQGIRPTGRFLALLLRNASTYSAGLEYLSCSNLTNQQVKSLCTIQGEFSGSNARRIEVLDSVPDYLFSAFIRFLCRFSVATTSFLTRSNISTDDAFPIVTGNWLKTSLESTTLFSYVDDLRTVRKFQHPRNLSHAIQLLHMRNSKNPQAWLQLMAALCTERIIGSSSNTLSRDTQRVLSWYEILEVIEWTQERDIELGFDGFQILCTSFSRAVAAGIRNPDAMEEGLQLVNGAVREGRVHFNFGSPEFENMVRNGLSVLKGQFDRLVLLDPKVASLFEPIRCSLETATDSHVTLPSLFRVPSPAVLHAFVRSLGLAEDSDGLLSLLRWMGQHASTLKDASDEYLNGDRMMRRTLIAVRLFLEGYWKRQSLGQITYEPEFASYATLHNDSDGLTFSNPDIQEAYDIVTATPIWGPWPSDEEVAEYVNHGMQ